MRPEPGARAIRRGCTGAVPGGLDPGGRGDRPYSAAMKG
jgi:hypothetical protein